MDEASANMSIASQLSNLSPDELLALRMIAFACRGRGLVVERCHRKLNEVSRKWRRDASKIVERLVNDHLITITRSNYRHVYKVRPDLLPSVVQVLFPEMLARMRATDLQCEGMAPAVFDFLAQLHLIMSLLNQQGIKLTNCGTIHRRMLKEFLQQLGLSESPVGNIRFNFLQQFVKDEGLIREDPATHEIGTSAKWAEYLEMPAVDKLRRAACYCYKTLIEQDPDADTALGLLALAGDKFLRLDKLVDEVALLGPGSSWQALKTRLETNLEVLLYLGVLEKAISKGAPCYRLSAFGRDLLFTTSDSPNLEFQNGFYVQPNFQVLVPYDADPTLIWHISRFSNLEQYDKWITFAVSRESIYRAISAGQSIEQILQFLREHADAPPPQNVEFVLRQWGAEYGALYFMKPLVLHCSTPELANQLVHSPKLQQYFLGKLSPSDIIVDQSGLSELQDLLKSDGYMPTPGVFEGPIHFSSEGV